MEKNRKIIFCDNLGKTSVQWAVAMTEEAWEGEVVATETEIVMTIEEEATAVEIETEVAEATKEEGKNQFSLNWIQVKIIR